MSHSAKEWWTLLATVQTLKSETALIAARIETLVSLLESNGTLSNEARAHLEDIEKEVAFNLTLEEVGSKEPLDPNADPRMILRESGVTSLPSASFVDHLESDFLEMTQAALQAYKEELGTDQQ